MEKTTPLASFLKLNEAQKKALKRANLQTIEDLLYYFPTRYEFFSDSHSIANLQKGDSAVIYGKISNLKLGKSFKKSIAMAEGTISDETGSIKLIWFNQPYIAKLINEGASVRISGKVLERKGELYIANGDIEETPILPHSPKESLFGESEDKLFAYPVYAETKGLTSKFIYFALQKVFRAKVHEKIMDPIPKEILLKYNLPTLSSSLVWIHSPKKEVDAIAARKRFAFEEVFYIQLILQKQKKEYLSLEGFKIKSPNKKIDEFIKRFPFTATNAQKRAIRTICDDFQSGKPMSRLLEGDVGSGKTAVAATTSYIIVTENRDARGVGKLQVAYMAPTEILAEQHFESFINYFKHLDIQIGLITGSGCKKFPSKIKGDGATNISRSQLLKWIKSGDISIVIGTHALIQKSVEFKNLAYIVIDEQHRFGTRQRQKLARKSSPLPHLLSMTATPIPRTLALTIYGDLELSLLDEMPVGRKKVITEITDKDKRNEVYEKIKIELNRGRQAYVICPRIEEPDPAKEMALQAKSVKAESLRLKKHVFQKWNIEILHSKMSTKEKEKIMLDFKNKKIDILVATSVVEVGVNVPNATSIIIEGAERFGLSQLHQLRGRVIRSEHQAYCYLFPESFGEKTSDRLKALVEAKNGFELAELDLKQRGSGELLGGKQWGVSDIGMEAIKNLKMVEAGREEARKIIESDNLNNYPMLLPKINSINSQLHFE